VTDSVNLDLVRSIYADWEHGNFRSTEWAHPNIEFVRPDGPEPGTWIGIPEMSHTTRDILTAWEDFRQVPDEFREVDAERVLVLFRGTGRGKRSGVDLQSKWANVFHLRDGKVTRILLYYDRNRAFADLGLEGQAMPEEPKTLDPAELARRTVEAFSRGDLHTALSVCAPDTVYESDNLGTRVEGVAAIRGFFEDFLASYEEGEGEILIKENRNLGNGVTLTVALARGRPVGSSGHVPFRFATVSVWVEDKITRFTTYTDIDEARTAAERLAEERG
jgi:ketosteroid isomerase-like protein